MCGEFLQMKKSPSTISMLTLSTVRAQVFIIDLESLHAVCRCSLCYKNGFDKTLTISFSDG